ncbi:dihydrofolate reductase family protein [Streptomyces sp. NPDC003042]
MDAGHRSPRPPPRSRQPDPLTPALAGSPRAPPTPPRRNPQPPFWPYEGKRVAVLSTTLVTDDPRVTVFRSLDELLAGLTALGAENVYVDGGRIIQTFLREGLLDELTITTAPVLIGSGLALFGELAGQDVELTLQSAKALAGGFTQATYTL